MGSGRTPRRAAFLTALVAGSAVAAAGLAYYAFLHDTAGTDGARVQRLRGDRRRDRRRDRRPRAERIAHRALGENRLRLGADAHESVALDVHPPVELDFLRSEDVLERRAARVAAHATLVDGPYRPSAAVFELEDGLPWWGLEGQLCRGRGERSIEGLSEESVLVLNPFLLIGPTEPRTVVRDPCGAPWLRVRTFVWDARRLSGRV